MKFIFPLFLSLSLSACAMQPKQQGLSKKNESEFSTIDLHKTADEAYDRSDWTESEKYYEKLVNIVPDLPQYWYRLGNIYTFTNRIDDAVIAYRQAITLAPADADVWLNLGMAHMKQAIQSFNAMENNVDSNNPSSIKGQKLLDEILKILEQSQ
ncbi:MAG: tetratricopeptide (TPR) repeat protein [Gammaproteobacteria bacterium]|jgi:tetratricopeptide (TPR) repeat protein